MIHLPQPTFPPLKPRLLPCPFCGGPAVVANPPRSFVGTIPLVWFVRCADAHRCNAAGPYRLDAAAAAGAWNNRAETPAHADRPRAL